MRLKRLEIWKGYQKSYRWQFGKLWEISAFPLTKLIMDVPGIHSVNVNYVSRIFVHADERPCHNGVKKRMPIICTLIIEAEEDYL